MGSSTPTLHSFKLDGNALSVRQSTALQLAAEKFVVTSVYVSNSTEQLFLGSRTGDLAIFSLPPPSALTSSLAASSYSPALYSTDTITSISLSGETLLTTSFSGVYATHTLRDLATTHISTPTSLSLISGHLFSTENELLVYGFRGTKFIVYNTHTASDVFTAECGGAHRAWTFYRSPLAWLVWSHGGKMLLARALRPRLAVLKHGSHGREIKAAAYSAAAGRLATGAEDTTIRISAVVAGRVVEAGAVAVKRHTTGLLGLAWSRDGRRLFSSGGVEELFVWRVGAAGVVLESTLPVDRSAAGEVRICGLAVRDMPGGFWVAGALSDGAVKLWRYWAAAGPGPGRWELVGAALYAPARCVLHARLLPVGAGDVAVLVAATDGALAVYDARMVQVWRKRVHQSSIKAMAAVVADGTLTVYTGGDDCAVALTTVKIDGWETGVCRLRPRAHASAVTAVVPMGGKLVTAGVDQRVTVWDGELTNCGSVYSVVADCSGAVEMGAGVVGVVGVGIESWRLDE